MTDFEIVEYQSEESHEMVFEHPMELMFGAECSGVSESGEREMLGATIKGFQAEIHQSQVLEA